MKARRKADILKKLESLAPESPSIERMRGRTIIIEELLRFAPERPFVLERSENDFFHRELINSLDIPSTPNLEE